MYLPRLIFVCWTNLAFLVMLYNPFICYWILFTSILWNIFAFIFMRYWSVVLFFLLCLCLVLISGQCWPHEIISFSYWEVVHGYTMVCLTIHLLMDFWVVSNFFPYYSKSGIYKIIFFFLSTKMWKSFSRGERYQSIYPSTHPPNSPSTHPAKHSFIHPFAAHPSLPPSLLSINHLSPGT